MPVSDATTNTSTQPHDGDTGQCSTKNHAATEDVAAAVPGEGQVDETGWPEWLRVHYKRLYNADLPENELTQWRCALRAWISMETMLDYKSNPVSPATALNADAKNNDPYA